MVSGAASKQIVIGSDHAGFALKQRLLPVLSDLGWTVTDIGCHSEDSVDYPNIAAQVAQTLSQLSDSATSSAENSSTTVRGVLVCGSGVGVCIGANRFPHIRAVLAHDETTARMSRRHNDANVLCLGGRVIAPELAAEILKVWLDTPFDGGRHEKRVGQLGAICC